jgi:hypothetical protein
MTLSKAAGDNNVTCFAKHCDTVGAHTRARHFLRSATVMGLGVKRKHSASELNLDALFADLDSSVTKATRPRAIPKKSAPVPPQHKKLGEAWNSDNTKKKSAERERELLALCDGLSDGLPTTPAKPTRRAPSRHATPLRKREVCSSSGISRQRHLLYNV